MSDRGFAIGFIFAMLCLAILIITSAHELLHYLGGNQS